MPHIVDLTLLVSPDDAFEEVRTSSNYPRSLHGVNSYVEWVAFHDERWQNPNNFSAHNMLHSALALCEEAGEVGGVVKKWDRHMTRREAGVVEMTAKTVEDTALVDRLLEELVDLEIYRAKIFLMLDEGGYLNRKQMLYLHHTPAQHYFNVAWRKKFRELHGRFEEGSDGSDCELCRD